MRFLRNCYNTCMANFLQYFILVVAGYLTGVAVNFIVEWFYHRRQFLGSEWGPEIRKIGWVRFLLWPFSSRTRHVAHKIRIGFVELAFMFLTPWLWVNPPEKVVFWWGFPVLVYFAVVIVMDIEFRVVLHPISIAGALLGLVVGVTRLSLSEALIGGGVGFLTMFLLYKFGEMFMRWINRRRGDQIDEVALGFGDVNMAGVIGLFLGWPAVIGGLLFAIFAGGGFSILFIIISLFLRKFKAFAALPYAPFLALAAIAMLFFPGVVATWFQSLGALLSGSVSNPLLF